MKIMLRVLARLRPHLLIVASIWLLASARGADNQPIRTREERELKMADDSIRASLAVSRSPKGRYLCSESPLACLGGDKAELGLALIGARSTKSSAAALASLVRYRMDASLAEDYQCYVLQKGNVVDGYFLSAKPHALEESCNSDLQQLLNAEQNSLEGLKPSAVCADEHAIEAKIKELLEAIHKGRKCGSEDF